VANKKYASKAKGKIYYINLNTRKQILHMCLYVLAVCEKSGVYYGFPVPTMWRRLHLAAGTGNLIDRYIY
jgi:hypothetical protein